MKIIKSKPVQKSKTYYSDQSISLPQQQQKTSRAINPSHIIILWPIKNSTRTETRATVIYFPLVYFSIYTFLNNIKQKHILLFLHYQESNAAFQNK